MSEQAVRHFIEALHHLEAMATRRRWWHATLKTAKLDNLTVNSGLRGRDGAQQLWSEHRELFHDLRSHFRNVIVADHRAALEWTIEGTARDGALVRFEGVSVLEFRDGLVTRLMAYFDPSNLGRQVF